MNAEGSVLQLALDQSIKMIGWKRQDFQVSKGRLEDTGAALPVPEYELVVFFAVLALYKLIEEDVQCCGSALNSMALIDQQQPECNTSLSSA